MPESARHEHEIPFTIDGRPFEIEAGKRESAGDLLRLAGLDPNGYDLAEVLGHGQLREFTDGQLVEVQPHEKFVSIRQTAPVA